MNNFMENEALIHTLVKNAAQKTTDAHRGFLNLEPAVTTTDLCAIRDHLRHALCQMESAISLASGNPPPQKGGE